MIQPMVFNGRQLAALSRDELIAQLEAELDDVELMKLARRMAPEVMRRAGIPPQGVNLIPWLTRVRCQTNAEAVVEWIHVQLQDPTFDVAATLVPKIRLLEQRLIHRFATSEGYLPW